MELSSLHTVLKQEGTSQTQRYLPALDPSYVQLSELGILDQLRFAEEFSHFLVYLRSDGNNQGLEKQTWKDFFSNDSTTLVAKIANHDVNKVKRHYATIFSAFGRQPLIFNFLKLISYTAIWIIQIDDWLKASDNASILHADLSLAIKAELSNKLVKLKEYFLATKIFGPQAQTFEELFNLARLEPVWGNLSKISAADQTIFNGNTEEEKLSNAAVYVNAIFETFLKTVGKTVSSADRYMQDSLSNDANHAPHMALFLSFLQIFEYGQKQLNTLSARHLDFYYKRFLQIPVRGPVADHATILFTLTKGMEAYALPALTSLTAGKDSANKIQNYLTDKELLITNASVDAIKSIYIDHTGSVIKSVYGAPVAASSDGKGAGFKTADTSWSMFGQASDSLISETGFAIASPQFLFKEGSRTINLDFELSSSLNAPVAESGELDPSLFSFYLSSEKGWISTIPAPNAKNADILIKSVRLDTSGPQHLLISLNIPVSTAKAITAFNQSIHGGQYRTAYPVLKAIIQYAPHPPAVSGFIQSGESGAQGGLGSEESSGMPDNAAPLSRAAVDNASSASDDVQSASDDSQKNTGWSRDQQRNFLQTSIISSLHLHVQTGKLGTGSNTTDQVDDQSVAGTDLLDSGIAGLSILQAANDDGDLDTSKPFMPFTAIPKIGSSFYINSPEFSIKPITNAAIYLDWMLPDNFDSYYQPYGVLYNDNNFQVNADLLTGQVYQKEGVYDLFDPESTTQLIELSNLDGNSFNNTLDSGNTGFKPGSTIRQTDGTLRLSLLRDFGHSIYPLLIVGSLMEKSGKLALSSDDTAGLKTEMAAHPLEFTQDAHTLKQLVTITNMKGAPEEQIHAALSKAISFSLVKHNITAVPNIIPEPDGSSKTGASGTFAHITASISNYFKTGSFTKSASSSATTTPYASGLKAASRKAASVNPAIEYAVRKETENHLDYVSHLAAAQLLANKANVSLTAEQLSSMVNEVLSSQQAAYIKKMESSTQDLLKVLSIPPPPYTPMLKSVQLAYESSRSFSDSYDTFYHILPYGVSTQSGLDETTAETTLKPALFPQFTGFTGGAKSADTARQAIKSLNAPTDGNQSASLIAGNLLEGQMLIGLSGIDAAQQLSLFFQILDGSNKEFGPPPTINWAYFSDKNWKVLPKDALISDSTYSLQSKGIIVFDLPDDIKPGNEQVGDDEQNLIWLRASTIGAVINLPRISAISPNAVTATFLNQDNSSDHYAQPLPAGSISKMTSKVAEVAKLNQPVATVGGKPAELQKEYFTRVSERLRHKNRAVTNWDYEHMLLEQFPKVYKVKCLNNFFVNRAVEKDKGKFIPGHLSLVLIPDLRNQNADETIPLKPRVTYKTLVDSEQYLQKYCPPEVQVHAVNPSFDIITISCTVKFRNGLDNGSQVKKLNADLIGFLAPWTVDVRADISFQVKIYASSLLDFIDKLPYIDYVTRFDMYCNDLSRPLVETTASTPFSIITSASKHSITYLEN